MTNKLTPEEEERFDEMFGTFIHGELYMGESDRKFKQHLANELQRQKKMLIKNVKNTWKKRFKEEKIVALQRQREEIKKALPTHNPKTLTRNEVKKVIDSGPTSVGRSEFPSEIEWQGYLKNQRSHALARSKFKNNDK